MVLHKSNDSGDLTPNTAIVMALDGVCGFASLSKESIT
ncbi:hypothetical protein LT85_3566 [Collimonas arenae]|uniref:Uncharacterized protein n=1 Tax=Collimonas arenae TaxID=279058 RepID=A0A0A1FGJ2_9BURK|nr:hypothetical protein LT85_3566 [Collimonas arenae]